MPAVSTPSQRPYRGIPASDRSRDQQRRLVDAVLAGLAEPSQALSIRNVSERAGLTRRYFYAHFGDLEAALVGAFDDVCGEVISAMRDALAPRPGSRPARQMIIDVLDASLGVLEAHPGKAQIILLSKAETGALGQRGRELADSMAQIVTEAVGGPDAGHPAVRFDSLFVVGGVIELVSRWLGDALPGHRDEVLASCADLILRVAAPPGGMRQDSASATGIVKSG